MFKSSPFCAGGTCGWRSQRFLHSAGSLPLLLVNAGWLIDPCSGSHSHSRSNHLCRRLATIAAITRQPLTCLTAFTKSRFSIQPSAETPCSRSMARSSLTGRAWSAVDRLVMLWLRCRPLTSCVVRCSSSSLCLCRMMFQSCSPPPPCQRASDAATSTRSLGRSCKACSSRCLQIRPVVV